MLIVPTLRPTLFVILCAGLPLSALDNMPPLAAQAEQVAKTWASGLVSVRVGAAPGAAAAGGRRMIAPDREAPGVVVNAEGWTVAGADMSTANIFGRGGPARMRVAVGGAGAAPMELGGDQTPAQHHLIAHDGSVIPARLVHLDEQMGLAVFAPLTSNPLLVPVGGSAATAPSRLTEVLAVSRSERSPVRPVVTWTCEVVCPLQGGRWGADRRAAMPGTLMLDAQGGKLGIVASSEGFRMQMEPMVAVVDWPSIEQLVKTARTAPTLPAPSRSATAPARNSEPGTSF